MNGYNGYPNYETWAVNMHYGEELREELEGRSFRSMYEASCFLRDRIEERIAEALEPMEGNYFVSDLLWASLGEVSFWYLAELYADTFTIEEAA